jgi:hypothetical protein
VVKGGREACVGGEKLRRVVFEAIERGRGENQGERGKEGEGGGKSVLSTTSLQRLSTNKTARLSDEGSCNLADELQRRVTKFSRRKATKRRRRSKRKGNDGYNTAPHRQTLERYSTRGIKGRRS